MHVAVMFLTGFQKKKHNSNDVCNSCHSFASLKCLANFSLKDILWHFQAKREAVEAVSIERGVECGEKVLLLVENNAENCDFV